MYGVDLGKIEPLKEQELDRFASERPRSKKLYQRALKSYLYGTPLHWMQQWPGSYPIYVDTAQGARLTDVDGNTYVDFALGDTGAMFGHANEAVVEAIYARNRRRYFRRHRSIARSRAICMARHCTGCSNGRAVIQFTLTRHRGRD